ncbi:HAD family hydrolase [Carboxylicivirga linearis]|uniref:Beta-phosphoglucomutase family hydrolase n=1 Tax=Carboxylicivirga linearis TaxID=1628157 RepID=A0ABS5JYK6_9BACT|nr:beta-phosphoglucomutase family hydrolase [Carboxylicivirga linearis]MBS2099496.1 beta-phosphoglucomutase family hydrolase [Carboxylicivirga linearis]
MKLNKTSLLDTVLEDKDIEALIFDMDGTLVDTLPVHYAAWLKACNNEVNFSMEYFIKLTGRPALELSKDIIRDFNVAMDPKELLEKKEALVKGQFNKMKVFPGISEVLNHFHSKIPMTVGTGATKEMANNILELTQLNQYFDYIVTSDDVQNYKPHPETFLKSANYLGIDPSKCLVFEDGQLGIEAAQKAGMKVVDVKPFYSQS